MRVFNKIIFCGFNIQHNISLYSSVLLLLLFFVSGCGKNGTVASGYTKVSLSSSTNSISARQKFLLGSFEDLSNFGAQNLIQSQMDSTTSSAFLNGHIQVFFYNPTMASGISLSSPFGANATPMSFAFTNEADMANSDQIVLPNGIYYVYALAYSTINFGIQVNNNVPELVGLPFCGQGYTEDGSTDTTTGAITLSGGTLSIEINPDNYFCSAMSFTDPNAASSATTPTISKSAVFTRALGSNSTSSYAVLTSSNTSALSEVVKLPATSTSTDATVWPVDLSYSPQSTDYFSFVPTIFGICKAPTDPSSGPFSAASVTKQLANVSSSYSSLQSLISSINSYGYAPTSIYGLGSFCNSIGAVASSIGSIKIHIPNDQAITLSYQAGSSRAALLNYSFNSAIFLGSNNNQSSTTGSNTTTGTSTTNNSSSNDNDICVVLATSSLANGNIVPFFIPYGNNVGYLGSSFNHALSVPLIIEAYADNACGQSTSIQANAKILYEFAPNINQYLLDSANSNPSNASSVYTSFNDSNGSLTLNTSTSLKGSSALGAMALFTIPTSFSLSNGLTSSSGASYGSKTSFNAVNLIILKDVSN